MSFQDDFLRGMKDCKKGIPSKSNQSEDYYRGYATQYQTEQIESERTRCQVSR